LLGYLRGATEGRSNSMLSSSKPLRRKQTHLEIHYFILRKIPVVVLQNRKILFLNGRRRKNLQ